MGDGKGTGACRTGVIYTTGSIFLQRHFGCVGKEMMACFGSLQNRMLKGGVVDSIRYSLRRHDFGFRWCRQNDIFTSLKGLLSPLGPHSGFGDKLLGTSVGYCFAVRKCSSRNFVRCFRLMLILMRSDSDLQIIAFRSEESVLCSPMVQNPT